MAAYRDFINTVRFAPNPNRNLDGSLPASLAGGDPNAGRNTFLNEPFFWRCSTMRAASFTPMPGTVVS